MKIFEKIFSEFQNFHIGTFFESVIFLKEKMEEPEFTKDPGITEPLDDHLGTFI